MSIVSAPPEPSSDLFVIDFDPQTLVIKIGSKNADPENKLHQVNSEDAQVLAVNTAKERGVSTVSIKRRDIHYGDDVKGIDATGLGTPDNPQPMSPFLVIQFGGARTGGSGYVGDSMVY